MMESKKLSINHFFIILGCIILLFLIIGGILLYLKFVPKPLSVSDLLKNPSQYENKEVVVKGLYYGRKIQGIETLFFPFEKKNKSFLRKLKDLSKEKKLWLYYKKLFPQVRNSWILVDKDNPKIGLWVKGESSLDPKKDIGTEVKVKGTFKLKKIKKEKLKIPYLQAKEIKILERKKVEKCSDGTPYGQCSQTKPKYCDNGKLIDRCDICGCPEGYSCQKGGGCAQAGEEVKIDINASKDKGRLSDIFSASVWIQKPLFTKSRDNFHGLSPYILEKFFDENRIEWIQTGNSWAIQSSEDFDDFKGKLKDTILNNEFWEYLRDFANENDVEVVFTFSQFMMPEWLSSRSSQSNGCSEKAGCLWSFSPPKCYKEKCYNWNEITCYTEKCREITERQFREKGYVEGWESVAKEYAKVLKELGIKKLGFCVGHEPNRDWFGKEETFYKLYEATVKGVKGYDPTIKTGGVGSWCWHCPKVSCEYYKTKAIWEYGKEVCLKIFSFCTQEGGWANPNNKSMTENFIEYCRKHNLPLDFINYHAFHKRPEDFIKQAKTIREWLGNNFSNVKIYPADWTIWGGPYAGADYIDTEENPAYVIKSLYHMAEAGIDWHGHDFDVGNGKMETPVIKERKNSQFIGDWPIFTREGVIKPVWNAFKALSKLEGRRIEATSTDEDHIIAIASKDKDTLRVIISNYIRPVTAVDALRFLKECMLSKYTEEEWDLIRESLKQTVKENPPQDDPDEDGIKKINENYIKWIIINTEFPSPLNTNQVRKDLKDCTPEVIKRIESEKYFAENPRDVTLVLRGINPGTYTLKTYLIDKDHANSCRYNKRTESTSTDTECGINGDIDIRVNQARKDARNTAEQQARGFLINKGYSDRDINYIFSGIEHCKGNITCFKNLVERYYQQSDRCRNHPQTCSFDIIWGEIKDAYNLYEDVFHNLFYYGKYKTITIPDYIDKINNDPNVSLEGSEKEKTIIVGENRTYKEKITMQPYSVILLEFKKRKR